MRKAILIIIVLIIGGFCFWFFVLRSPVVKEISTTERGGIEKETPISPGQGSKIETPEAKSMPEQSSNKKIAMIIAFKDFQDQEYFNTKEVLENSGAEITTLSSSSGRAIGKYGGEVEIDRKIDELKVEDFDAVVFIGGPGAAGYIDDAKCHQIAKETVEKDKVLGAICIAPAILAKAGVLQGKKATVWTSLLDKSAAKILKENGADYRGEDVVADGKIITANGPAAAEKFGQAIVTLLK